MENVDFIDKHAVWTAVVTPFFPDGSIDFASLENLVIDQECAGNGIMLLGSTGENVALSLEEREMITAFVANLGLNVPILVGVPGLHFEEVLAWMRYCEGLPVAGYQLVTPIYSRPGRYGQTAWFNALLMETQRPCMLYNIPSRSGCNLSMDTVLDLLDHPNFWSIKEASGSESFLKILRTHAPSIKIFTGNDPLIAQDIANGACGVVSVMSNIWPQATQRYVDDCLNGQGDKSAALWETAAQGVNVNNPVSIKKLLHDQGKIAYNKVRAPLDLRDGADMDLLHKSDDLIKEWQASLKEEARSFTVH